MPLDGHLAQLDVDLVNAAKPIRLLSSLTWPQSDCQDFFRRVDTGKAMPTIDYPVIDLAPQRRSLDQVARDAERIGGALADYLAATAKSYHLAAELIEHAGSPRAGSLSLQLFGSAGDKLVGSSQTNLDAAHYFLDVTQAFTQSGSDPVEPSLSPEEVASYLDGEIKRVLADDKVDVVVDPALVSKAAAGLKRIRIRANTPFSKADAEQLLQHEAFVHTLTALNGQRQPLGSMSLGAPRTTATQEGLATFAELVTGVIDLARMGRIALRIEAIDAALRGADFVAVFRLFKERGQSPNESFNSAMRVFRGVPLSGGHAFTKDGVYLHGLLEVHTFFRWALQEKRLGLLTHLFAGRMTLKDSLALEGAFDDGSLYPPRYLPPWLTQKDSLTAYLAFSVFANAVQLHELTEAEFAGSLL